MSSLLEKAKQWEKTKKVAAIETSSPDDSDSVLSLESAKKLKMRSSRKTEVLPEAPQSKKSHRKKGKDVKEVVKIVTREKSPVEMATKKTQTISGNDVNVDDDDGADDAPVSKWPRFIEVQFFLFFFCRRSCTDIRAVYSQEWSSRAMHQRQIAPSNCNGCIF